MFNFGNTNIRKMNDTLFYTLPQWMIFAGIIAVTYGWVENKRPFRIIGATLFVVLGIFSLGVLLGDYFAANNLLSAEEVITEELNGEINDEIPFQAQIFPAYLSFLAAAILALPAIFFDFRKSNKYRWFIVLTGLVALFGFFVIVGAVKAL